MLVRESRVISLCAWFSAFSLTRGFTKALRCTFSPPEDSDCGRRYSGFSGPVARTGGLWCWITGAPGCVGEGGVMSIVTASNEGGNLGKMMEEEISSDSAMMMAIRN